MKIINPRGELMKVAIIDPALRHGEPGQYVAIEETGAELLVAVARARFEEKEIRYYYKELDTEHGEKVMSQIIITEMPPGHVQPFHTHHTLHEIIYVQSGCVVAVETDDLSESDSDKIREQGTLMYPGAMMINEPGGRHTMMNPDVGSWAVTVCVQTARIPLDAFPADWVRDRPDSDAARKVIELKGRRA